MFALPTARPHDGEVKSSLSAIVLLATSLASFSHEESLETPPAEVADIHLVAPAAWEGYEVNRDLVPSGKFARKLMEPMTPRYVTVHSTQNFAAGADALAHAKLQRLGKFTSTHNRIGYLAWHFTVDQSHAIQSLPCNERGEHADYDGPGNTYSIGVEMCEHLKNDRAKTLDRTARLCALLMAEYQIPLQHIVPHYHWPRIRDDKKDLGHKNCPHYLLENGKPGKKWQQFLGQVLKHYKTHPKYDAALVVHQASLPPVVARSKPEQGAVRKGNPETVLPPASKLDTQSPN
ncbi:MAG: N-acetylmuramoyl-L-alanine amidase [Verrucomicrobiales bacterium]